MLPPTKLHSSSLKTWLRRAAAEWMRIPKHLYCCNYRTGCSQFLLPPRLFPNLPACFTAVTTNSFRSRWPMAFVSPRCSPFLHRADCGSCPSPSSDCSFNMATSLLQPRQTRRVRCLAWPLVWQGFLFTCSYSAVFMLATTRERRSSSTLEKTSSISCLPLCL